MTTAFEQRVQRLLAQMRPISLEEMKEVRLMKRTDQKYVTNEAQFLHLLELLAERYFVQAIDEKRVARYRSVYFDDCRTHKFFRRHHCGALPRVKVRARAYLETNYNVLEIKRKNNHGKTSKKRVKVRSLEAVLNEREGEDFLRAQLGEDFESLTPTVGNRFKRITLVNDAMTERLTIDYDLSFDNFETGREAQMENLVVVELKRDGRVPSPVLSMLRTLRIKPSGFSKYCIGTVATNKEQAHNRFKPKTRYVSRVTAAPFPKV